MSEYRRWWVPGGTYFFTVNLADRSQRLLVERFDALREVACAVRRAHPFDVVAWVVMPNHLHAIWALPDGDHDFARRWMLIKQVGWAPGPPLLNQGNRITSNPTNASA